MVSVFDSPISDLVDSELKDELDADVLASLMAIDHPRDAISTSKKLKEDRNLYFRQKNFPSAIERYEKSLQYLCVSLPTT